MDTTDKFFRDPKNPGSLVSNDLTGLQGYKLRKRLLKEKDQKIKSLEERLNNLEQLMSEIMKAK